MYILFQNYSSWAYIVNSHAIVLFCIPMFIFGHTPPPPRISERVRSSRFDNSLAFMHSTKMNASLTEGSRVEEFLPFTKERGKNLTFSVERNPTPLDFYRLTCLIIHACIYACGEHDFLSPLSEQRLRWRARGGELKNETMDHICCSWKHFLTADLKAREEGKWAYISNFKRDK